MGFPILVRWNLYIESGPRSLHSGLQQSARPHVRVSEGGSKVWPGGLFVASHCGSSSSITKVFSYLLHLIVEDDWEYKHVFVFLFFQNDTWCRRLISSIHFQDTYSNGWEANSGARIRQRRWQNCYTSWWITRKTRGQRRLYHQSPNRRSRSHSGGQGL